MSYAFLGFPDGGPSVSFRIDPEQVEWNFNIHTRVFETIGGRVIQVLGGALSDLVISGSMGEEFDAKNSEGEFEGESWRLHESFVKQVRRMMTYQSRDATIHREYSSKMNAPAKFTYAPKGWNFSVYIKELSDPEGGSITHKVGRVNHKYQLTLFIVEDYSSAITRIKTKAVNDYIDRISEGIGWKYSAFTGEGWENLDPNSDQWGKALDLSAIGGGNAGDSDGDPQTVDPPPGVEVGEGGPDEHGNPSAGLEEWSDAGGGWD